MNLNDISNTDQLRTVTFTNNGLRMFIGNDQSDTNPSGDNIFEYNLVCPFNIISANVLRYQKIKSGQEWQ